MREGPRKARVAILGCGPAGLLCAWAAELAGHQPVIFSRKQKSVIPGSQHLHGPVPGLTSQYPEGTIQFVRIGTAAGYAEKVYGDAERETGWDNYLQVYPSWNVLRAYDKLWAHFEDRIKDCEISQLLISGLVQDDWLDMIISTIPAQAICDFPWKHEFEGVPYFIKQLPLPPGDEQHEIVVYNGIPGDPWYRWSILGGLCSIESALEPEDPEDDAEQGWVVGTKAIGNNCDCWPTIHRCGRWAEWTHGVTMFKAYEKAVRLMEGLA